MNRFDDLKKVIDLIVASNDVNKFYKKGRKAAGVRLRKQMQEVRELALLVRLEISEINRNTKKRV